jgi:hypothetical protein
MLLDECVSKRQLVECVREVVALNHKSGHLGRSLVASTDLCLDDAVYRADIHTFRGIEVTNAFHASGRVDDVEIAFGD